MNLPWSKSKSDNDVWWNNCDGFKNKEVVITHKLDGECITIYEDGTTHARSLDSRHHPSRSWIKSIASKLSHEIPNNWRICGENLYAWHSIFYTNLPTYFFVFGIYDENNNCIGWQETKEWCNLLSLHTVPVIYEGTWDETHIKNLQFNCPFPTFTSPNQLQACESEGYVVRLRESFHFDQFNKSVAKYVRPHHVQTDEHWMYKKVIPNDLAK